MLATALALGASPRGYLDPAHPVQTLIRRHLSLMSDVAEAELLPLIDGCSAPTYALPLRSIATAFARLSRPENLPLELREAARLLTAAMIAFPELVQGPGSFNTALLRESAGAVVAKGGAEGLFALGLPGSGLGIAVKVADGSSRPWPPVVLALLRRLLPLPPGLEAWARPEEVNCHGTVVGHVEATAAVDDLHIQIPPVEEACL
jgi:L-asparaginase II